MKALERSVELIPEDPPPMTIEEANHILYCINTLSNSRLYRKSLARAMDGLLEKKRAAEAALSPSNC